MCGEKNGQHGWKFKGRFMQMIKNTKTEVEEGDVSTQDQLAEPQDTQPNNTKNEAGDEDEIKEEAPTISNEKNESEKPVQFSEVNKRYVLGEVAGTFKQVPFVSEKSDEKAFHRNDIVADIAKIDSLLVMGAALRGESHYAHRTPRQDNFLIEECYVTDDKKFVIASIADGVGNSKKADEFSEMLVNFLCKEVSTELYEKQKLSKIDWDAVVEKIWKIAVNYCNLKSGSKCIDDYFENWASTLECIVIETQASKDLNFVAATICGDGGIYKLNALREWETVKHGKTHSESFVTNAVQCLPDEPTDPIIKNGTLSKGESLFMATDGLSDYIEASDDVRQFFMNFLPRFPNLPEFIRVLNVAVQQMDDDKTGILISHYNEPTQTNEVIEYESKSETVNSSGGTNAL